MLSTRLLSSHLHFFSFLFSFLAVVSIFLLVGTIFVPTLAWALFEYHRVTLTVKTKQNRKSIQLKGKIKSKEDQVPFLFVSLFSFSEFASTALSFFRFLFVEFHTRHNNRLALGGEDGYIFLNRSSPSLPSCLHLVHTIFDVFENIFHESINDTSLWLISKQNVN